MTTRLTCTLLLFAAGLLGACATPPGPTPPPLPPVEAAPLPTTDPGAPTETHTDMPVSEPGSAQNYPAPSADAAEVEMEEVAVGAPASSAAAKPAARQEVLAHMSDAGGDGRAQGQTAGGGGSALPPGGPVHGTSGGEPRSGHAAAAPEPPLTDQDLVGPALDIGGGGDPDQARFEALMRRARISAEEEKLARAGAPSGQLDGRGQRLDGPPAQRGGGGAGEIGTGIGNTPDLSGETSGQHRQMALAGPPPGTPDGRDDDIVARQLREAASAEKDPILRDKLWEEYRKYKAGL